MSALRKVLSEAKLELAYFFLGMLMVILSAFSGDLAPVLFWGGALLSFLGWIAFGFKVRALILSSKIELLREMVHEEVESRRSEEKKRDDHEGS